jgi:release factor glutamine methyltransferase
VTQDVWTIRKVLTWATDDLRSRDSDTPRLDAELLLAHVLRINRIGLITDADRPLSKEELTGYRELHKRRRAGEPVAYLLRVREFYGRPFRVDKRVLVPRPDTEILVEVALERMRALSLSARVLDLCTGSGCVAVTLAKERPTWSLLGSDVSEDALVVARENALRLGALPRIAFTSSDLFAGIASGARFDLITANPPYIPDGDKASLAQTIVGFEPHVALFGGSDGLAFAKKIITGAAAFLRRDGVLAMEIGAGQAQEVAAHFREHGFRDVEVKKDYGNIERVVSGVHKPQPEA